MFKKINYILCDNFLTVRDLKNSQEWKVLEIARERLSKFKLNRSIYLFSPWKLKLLLTTVPLQFQGLFTLDYFLNLAPLKSCRVEWWKLKLLSLIVNFGFLNLVLDIWTRNPNPGPNWMQIKLDPDLDPKHWSRVSAPGFHTHSNEMTIWKPPSSTQRWREISLGVGVHPSRGLCFPGCVQGSPHNKSHSWAVGLVENDNWASWDLGGVIGWNVEGDCAEGGCGRQQADYTIGFKLPPITSDITREKIVLLWVAVTSQRCHPDCPAHGEFSGWTIDWRGIRKNSNSDGYLLSQQLHCQAGRRENTFCSYWS
jgi:hypothetical protein